MTKAILEKIRAFQRKYPNKKVHVDGGVNAEVSFILRNMGVYASVSGSYLFNSANINTALLNLKLNEIESHFMVQDFMRDLDESPIISIVDLNLKSLLEVMNAGRLGFVIIVNEDQTFKGIIGNADLRNGLLMHIDGLETMDVTTLINENPLVVKGTYTVYQLLSFIKKEAKTIVYLPVISDDNKAIGSINFMNLIKGEL